MITKYSPTSCGHSMRQEFTGGGSGYFCTLEHRMCHQVRKCPARLKAIQEAEHEADH